VECTPLGIGLSVCTHIEHTEDGNLCGINCNADKYDGMSILYIAIVGRPPTVGSRRIRWLLNGVVADDCDGGDDYHVLYNYPLTDRDVGWFRVEYVENNLVYWAHEFAFGICPVPTGPPIEIEKLINVLRKFRT